ncbi:MAG: hypothetical protein IJ100_01665 [Lachnospiraceae bacterium]|jgi:NRPS condensation-like uncharacterized protein|nr:hypothetical protein [Lachnospiraceae bacterium]
MAQSKWYQLDNAAKIVPSTAGGADTRVFRITCELKEDVDPDTLQSAVSVAARDFPHFGSILKKGLFWYYLDQSNLDAEVTPDNKPALDTIYREGRRDLLYRVSYYRNRINLEMFHVLTDGTGAFEFLKAILTEYLGVKYQIEELATETSRASGGDRQGDAFGKYYQKAKDKPEEAKVAPKRAYHLRGEKDENLQNHLLEGTVSVPKFLKAARERGCTVAELSTALFIKAILEEMSVRDRRLPIVLSVPVNLRNYFPSDTARNFFGVINVAYDPANYDGTVESIIGVVKESFVRQLRQDQVELTMNSYAALEHNIAVKVVPLTIKNLVISAINAHMQKGITGTISNVGKISVPAEMEPHIHKFSCFMAAPEVQVCLCSYKDLLVFGVASAFVEHPVMRNFFRDMVDMGIDVELESNDFDNEPAKKEEA